ncbi:IS66 family transposase, partial [Hydrogenophaga sp. 2FB]|uniref:IS66 family transposase n=1 Tax=Hydrogenophaga sp. 2FB TaxID=2502187 RepID=UPI0010F59BB4
MLDVTTLNAQDLKGLSKSAVTELATALLAQLSAQGEQLSAQQSALLAKDEHLAQRDREIKFKDAKIERITFELARLKAWKFGAKTERMNAEQRQMFEETAAEDEASLQAQLQALQGTSEPSISPPADKRQPRRQPLPEQLRRVEHRHEPENTTCPSPGCGQAMVRIGEDVSERLDIVPAEFFVHRHVRGKWACKCCQVLVQEPVVPQIIDKGMPASGLLAHTLVSRFVDHLPYYRQEQINARSGVHTPRSTLAAWSGAAGASLLPLYDAHRAFVLGAQVLHADETPVRMLDPGAGKTAKAYIWAYARGEHDPTPGVIYDFCAGRGAKYPMAFLQGWSGTVICDDYKGYDAVFRAAGRTEAGCLAHARRKFDELAKAHASPVAAQAIQRIAGLYRIEQEASTMTAADRLAFRRSHAQPLWDELHVWLRLERTRVADGGGIAAALDYSLKRWDALGRFLHDGEVSIDNNHIERLMRPWAMGRNKANSTFMRSRHDA